MDFLKMYPSVKKDEYMWEWTIPQIKLALFDYTHVRYLSENEAKAKKAKKKGKKYTDPRDFVKDLNIPVF